MPYYIIACHKEGQTEDQVQNTIAQNVVKERNMVIGHCFPLTNDKVSKSDLFNLPFVVVLGQENWVQDRIFGPADGADGYFSEVRDTAGC